MKREQADESRRRSSSVAAAKGRSAGSGAGPSTAGGEGRSTAGGGQSAAAGAGPSIAAGASLPAGAGEGSSIEDHVAFHSVGFNLSSLGYAVSRSFRETLAPLELEPREFSLLRAIAAAEGQSQQALGEKLLIPASRMVAFVDALEERGLLERRANPEDRRARALYLTAGGRHLLGEAFSLALAFERMLCAGLSDAEREQLVSMLGRVGAQLGMPESINAAHAAHAAHAAMMDDDGTRC